MTDPRTVLWIASCILAFTLQLISAEPVPFVLIEGTQSPDGRFSFAWGHSDHSPVKPDETDFDRINNYLVDVKARTRVLALGTEYWAFGDAVRNHESFEVAWRADSKAVCVLVSGKWETHVAAVIYVVEPEAPFEPVSDLLHFRQALARIVSERVSERFPKRASETGSLAVSLSEPVWMDAERLKIHVSAYIPKADDDFGLLGPLIVRAPDPDVVTLAE